ncbi:ATP-dependent DNA helicase-like protein RECG chloroplastic [Bienertia sinuspersici]
MISSSTSSEYCIRSAVIFYAEGGYHQLLTKRMRYNQIVVSKIPKLCYRSKHKTSEKMVDSYGVGSISDRSRFIKKGGGKVKHIAKDNKYSTGYFCKFVLTDQITVLSTVHLLLPLPLFIIFNLTAIHLPPSTIDDHFRRVLNGKEATLREGINCCAVRVLHGYGFRILAAVGGGVRDGQL